MPNPIKNHKMIIPLLSIIYLHLCFLPREHFIFSKQQYYDRGYIERFECITIYKTGLTNLEYIRNDGVVPRESCAVSYQQRNTKHALGDTACPNNFDS